MLNYNNYIPIFLILLLGVLAISRPNVEGFRPFSYLGEDISQIVPVSKSNRVNIYIPKDQKFKNTPKHVYFGSPAPLLHQMKSMPSPTNSMFYFSNYECKPECCPSPYMCSGGCVCIGPKNIYQCDQSPPIERSLPGPNSF